MAPMGKKAICITSERVFAVLGFDQATDRATSPSSEPGVHHLHWSGPRSFLKSWSPITVAAAAPVTMPSTVQS